MRAALFILFALALASPADAVEKDCRTGFSRLMSGIWRSTPAEQVRAKRDAIGDTKIRDFFPDSIEIPAGKNKGILANIKPEQIARFNKRFKEYLNYEAKLNPDIAREVDQFEDWLRTKKGNKGPYPELNPIDIEAYRAGDLSFRDFFYDQFVQYKVEALEHNSQVFLDYVKSLKPKSSRDVVGAVRRMLGKTMGVLGTGVVAGAVVANVGNINQFVQGFTGPMLKMLFGESNAKAIGEKQAENLIGSTMDYFEGGREKYKDSLGKIESIRGHLEKIDFNAMDRDRGREILNETDRDLAKQLEKFSKVLDRADKERHKKRHEYLKGMLNGISIAKADWNAQKAELEKMQNMIRWQKREPTYWEKKDMAEIESSMKDSERTIAEVLAVWRVYKQTVGDKGPSLPDEVEKPLMSMYGQYMRWMDLNEYRNEYGKAILHWKDLLESYYK